MKYVSKVRFHLVILESQQYQINTTDKCQFKKKSIEFEVNSEFAWQPELKKQPTVSIQ